MNLVIRLNWARMALMVIYIVGVAAFIYAQEIVSALLLCAVIYWTNVAWFNQGLLGHSVGLLKEAQAIMEQSIAERKRTSVRKGKTNDR